ncbi:MAG: asparagine synthase [Proteobacteria bacterium]|nr:asparagine synthase [Pseudomonadota bacterium]
MAPDGAEMAADGVTDDLPYAKRVAEYLGVRLHAIPVKSDVIGRLGQALFHLDEPIADPAAINVMLISELARDHDIKVLLSGAVGTIFSPGTAGTGPTLESGFGPGCLQRFGRATARGAGRLRFRIRCSERYARFCRMLEAPMRSGCSGIFTGRIRPSLRDCWLKRRRCRARICRCSRPYRACIRPSGLDRMLLLEQRHFLSDHNLIYTDKLTMAAGVEGPMPFLDLDLVGFVNSLPPRSSNGTVSESGC